MSATPIDLLTAIGTYVATNGYGTVGTDLFLNLFPENPRECFAIMLSGGPGYHREKLHTHLISVYVRSANPHTALTKIGSINGLFDDKFGQLQSSGIRGRFVAFGELGPPSQDKAGDTMYTRTYAFFSDS